jgi:hypothetical protein
VTLGRWWQRLRFLGGLGPFLRETLRFEDCQRIITEHLASRTSSFLQVVEHCIFGAGDNPYRQLLTHAGYGLGEIERLVASEGLEGALETLREAGVYLTLDEFKGRTRISRPGLCIETTPSSFDSPVLRKAYPSSSSGSRGAGTRVLIDLDFLKHEAAESAMLLHAFECGERPFALWRPPPPGLAGLKEALRHAKIGHPVARWFSQASPRPTPRTLAHMIFTRALLKASRFYRRPLPEPEHVPSAEAERVARWLEAERAHGTPAMLDTTPSSAVRICRAAEAAGLDISGTVLRLGGEPFTNARARILDAAKCRAVVRYSMAEVGMIGIGCPRPAFTDEVHILSDKLAIITQPRELDPGSAPIDAMLLTTLLPSCPKLMLNVEVDDYGVLGPRPCGCPLERIGLSLHLHTIRSFEKLTSEGTCFTGADLLELIEEVLPTRFGGAPTDYQLVEEEVDGLPRISLLVSPRIGRADPEALVAAVFDTLAMGDASRPMMLEQWRGNETLRLVRRDPIETASGKVLPLHILGPHRGGA